MEYIFDSEFVKLIGWFNSGIIIGALVGYILGYFDARSKAKEQKTDIDCWNHLEI